jgi:hypothetical protein
MKDESAFPVLTNLPGASVRAALGPLQSEIYTQAARAGTIQDFDVSLAYNMGQVFEQAELQKMFDGSLTPIGVGTAYQSKLLADRQTGI